MKNTLNNIALSFVLLAGCNAHYTARLDNGGGLGEGSRVVVSGVQVGAVSGVRVVEGHVDVELEIESEHEISIRQDACAIAVPEQGGGYLLLTPGTGAVREDQDRPIPQCRIETNAVTDDTFRHIADSMGQLIEQLGRGIFAPPAGNNGPIDPSSPMPPFPSIPMPVPQTENEACEHVSVRAGDVEHVAEGYRAWIDFHNDNPFSMRISGVSDASFMDAEGRVLEHETMPSTDAWFMPFDVPASASRRVAVIFHSEPAIATIEVRQSAPVDDALSWCTISNR